MPAKLIFIRTIDKLVLSESSATAGQHKSLDYIPGSALLGAVAAKLYQKLGNPQIQWAVFHSGRLRFGNAYPAVLTDQKSEANGECFCLPGWPMPFSYHVEKNASAFQKGFLQKSLILDLSNTKSGDNNSTDTAQAEDATAKQYKQVREGYLTHRMQEITTQSDYQLKTAIDYNKGSANDGQLYGYHTLAAEQWFAGELSCDDTFEEDYPGVWDAVVTLLNTEMLRIGRAKSAEFGRVAIQLQEFTPPPVTVEKAKPLKLFCLSDLALKDEFGQPTFTLTAAHLNLPDDSVQLQDELCFVRTRQYSVYNAKRGAYDQQRQVISKGSVFVFKVQGDVAEVQSRLKSTLQTGIGLYTEAGLGRLRTQLEIPEMPDLQPIQMPVVAEKPVTPLMNWLSRKAGISQTQSMAAEKSNKLLRKLSEIYRQGRTLAVVAKTEPWGPNKHNWSAVLREAKRDNGEGNQTLLERLFKGESPPVKLALDGSANDKFKKDDNWQQSVMDTEGRYISFAYWLYSELEALAGEPDVNLYAVVQLLARNAMSENFGAREQ